MNTNESKGRESEKSESVEHDGRDEAVSGSGSASDNVPRADEREMRSASSLYTDLSLLGVRTSERMVRNDERKLRPKRLGRTLN